MLVYLVGSNAVVRILQSRRERQKRLRENDVTFSGSEKTLHR